MLSTDRQDGFGRGKHDRPAVANPCPRYAIRAPGPRYARSGTRDGASTGRCPGTRLEGCPGPAGTDFLDVVRAGFGSVPSRPHTRCRFTFDVTWQGGLQAWRTGSPSMG